MINIVCVKWGTKYGPEYVNRLLAGFGRNSSFPFKFHCFTEDSSKLSKDVIIHDLPYKKVTGWWNKLYLFSNEINIPQGETILFVDLDTLITSNVDDILKCTTDGIVVLKNFVYEHLKKNKPNMYCPLMGSGLMMWKHGNFNNVWESFIKDSEWISKVIARDGDQEWINRCIPDNKKIFWQSAFPERVVSFKMHCQQGLPEKCSIICYHGRPSIPDSVNYSGTFANIKLSPQPWILDHWKE